MFNLGLTAPNFSFDTITNNFPLHFFDYLAYINRPFLYAETRQNLYLFGELRGLKVLHDFVVNG